MGGGGNGAELSPSHSVAAGTGIGSGSRPHVGYVAELEKGFHLFRSRAPRFVGHGLFHVLSELLPRDAAKHGDLTIHSPAAWEAFCLRWDRHPSLRLVWYAPEDHLEDDLSVGAARMFYVLEYSHLTPRTWRYALDPAVVAKYSGGGGGQFQWLEPEGAVTGPPRTVGKTFKHYLHPHVLDPRVVTHSRGGVLLLLNATQECTHGMHALTQSQLPITICVVVRRSLLTLALWCALRQERRVFRLDLASQWAWSRFCEPTLRWSALRLQADLLDEVEDELALRAADVTGFHCARLEICHLRSAHHDLVRVMTLAKLLAWRLLRTTKPRVVALEGLQNTDTLMPPSTDASKLRHASLRKLFTELSDTYAALSPPINVLYV